MSQERPPFDVAVRKMRAILYEMALEQSDFIKYLDVVAVTHRPVEDDPRCMEVLILSQGKDVPTSCKVLPFFKNDKTQNILALDASGVLNLHPILDSERPGVYLCTHISFTVNSLRPASLKVLFEQSGTLKGIIISDLKQECDRALAARVVTAVA